MPPPMIRTSNCRSEAPVILPKYKELDRKIRISCARRPRHPSIQSNAKFEEETTMQVYRVVALGSGPRTLDAYAAGRYDLSIERMNDQKADGADAQSSGGNSHE